MIDKAADRCCPGLHLNRGELRKFPLSQRGRWRSDRVARRPGVVLKDCEKQALNESLMRSLEHRDCFGTVRTTLFPFLRGIAAQPECAVNSSLVQDTVEVRAPQGVRMRPILEVWRTGWPVVPQLTARKPVSSPPYRIGCLAPQIPKSRAVCLGEFPPVLRVPGEPVWKLLRH